MPLTGTVAVDYMSALFMASRHDARLDVRRLSRDALAALHSKAARARLRLAACRAAYRLPGYVGFAPARKWLPQTAAAVRPRRRERRPRRSGRLLREAC